ncbi:MAG: hypothetical protein ACE5F6_00400 [Anaerolineae bacterium]
MRVTKGELEQLVTVLNNRITKKNKEYRLEYVYGAPRLILEETVSPYGAARDISPRLPAREMKIGLSAFIDGVDEVRHPH